MIPNYESHHPVCLDVEWLLPTLFDASLLTFEPPLAALFLFLALPRAFLWRGPLPVPGRAAGLVSAIAV